MQDYTYDEVTGQWAIWQWDENNERWVFLRWASAEEAQTYKQSQVDQVDINRGESGASFDPVDQYTEVISADLSTASSEFEQLSPYPEQSGQGYSDPAQDFYRRDSSSVEASYEPTQYYEQAPVSAEYAQSQYGQPQYSQPNYAQAQLPPDAGRGVYIPPASQLGMQNQMASGEPPFTETEYKGDPYNPRSAYVGEFGQGYANDNREAAVQPKRRVGVILGVLVLVVALIGAVVFGVFHFGVIDFSNSKENLTSQSHTADKDADKQRQEQLEKEKDEATKEAEEAKREVEKIKREAEEKAKKEAEEKTKNNPYPFQNSQVPDGFYRMAGGPRVNSRVAQFTTQTINGRNVVLVTTPANNIFCVITDGKSARCFLKASTYPNNIYPKPEEFVVPEEGQGYVAGTLATGPEWGIAPTEVDTDTDLEYGDIVLHVDFHGVTVWNSKTHHGIFLRQREYMLF